LRALRRHAKDDPAGKRFDYMDRQKAERVYDASHDFVRRLASKYQ